MLQRFAPAAFVIGALLAVSVPGIGLAAEHGRSGGGHGDRGRSYSAPRSYGGSRYGGGQSFVAPREYSGGHYGGRYVVPRSYGRPYYRGYYGGGVYLYGAPYGYSYAPGYLYDPGDAYGPSYSYGSAPAVPQTCTEGSYDQYGNWVPNPNCYSSQQQYPQQQQPAYDPNQQPYPQQQQYPPQQPNYNPYQQPYNR